MSLITMITSTGVNVPVGRPQLEHIDVLDIAHHLALINRFNGATTRPYSVAEHSLLCVEIAERDLGVRSPSALMAVLMHDAHEAYLGDITTPVKMTLARNDEGMLLMLESTLHAAVARRFDLRQAYATHRELVRRADLMALATERRDLLHPNALRTPWPLLNGIEPAGWTTLTDLHDMDWQDWRQALIDKFAELQHGRELQEQTEPAAAVSTTR